MGPVPVPSLLYSLQERHTPHRLAKTHRVTPTATGRRPSLTYEGRHTPLAVRCLPLPQVVGVNTVDVQDAEGLIRFFSDCFDNRAVAATKMNDRSSRSHAIYTVLINRTIVDVSDGGDKVGWGCLGSVR